MQKIICKRLRKLFIGNIATSALLQILLLLLIIVIISITINKIQKKKNYI